MIFRDVMQPNSSLTDIVKQGISFCLEANIFLEKCRDCLRIHSMVISLFIPDHVGIVYRSEQYGLCLFESNSGTGVAMAIWRQLLRYQWYEGLERISWRKLRNNKEGRDFQKKVT